VILARKYIIYIALNSELIVIKDYEIILLSDVNRGADSFHYDIIVTSFDSLHNLQMQYPSMCGKASLALEMDPSSWMMWPAEELRQTLLTVLTVGLASMTVTTLRMQE